MSNELNDSTDQSVEVDMLVNSITRIANGQERVLIALWANASLLGLIGFLILIGK
jgi:hypothetical protein